MPVAVVCGVGCPGAPENYASWAEARASIKDLELLPASEDFVRTLLSCGRASPVQPWTMRNRSVFHTCLSYAAVVARGRSCYHVERANTWFGVSSSCGHPRAMSACMHSMCSM